MICFRCQPRRPLNVTIHTDETLGSRTLKREGGGREGEGGETRRERERGGGWEWKEEERDRTGSV